METYTLLALLMGGAMGLRYFPSDSPNILQTFLKAVLAFSEQRTIHKNAHGVQCIGVCLQDHRQPSPRSKGTR